MPENERPRFGHRAGVIFFFLKFLNYFGHVFHYFLRNGVAKRISANKCMPIVELPISYSSKSVRVMYARITSDFWRFSIPFYPYWKLHRKKSHLLSVYYFDHVWDKYKA